MALEEHPLAQPRLGCLQGVEAARSQRALHHHRSRQDQVRPRRLHPRHARALRGCQRRQPLDDLPQRLARHGHALHAVARQPFRALRHGGEAAHRPADPHQAPARLRQPRRALELLRHVLAQRLDLARLRRAAVGQEALRHPHRPHPPRARLLRPAVPHPHQLHRAAAQIQHAAVAQRRRVDRRQVSITGLLLAAQHADRQLRALARLGEERRRVLGVADRAGGHGVHRAAARAGPCTFRSFSAPPRLLPFAPAWSRAGAIESPAASQKWANTSSVASARCIGSSPSLPVAAIPSPILHHLVDLVAALPPPLRGGEHHQPEGVRAEVDHREALA